MLLFIVSMLLLWFQIQIISWFDDPNDQALLLLIPYLVGLAQSDQSVVDYLRTVKPPQMAAVYPPHTPSWLFLQHPGDSLPPDDGDDDDNDDSSESVEVRQTNQPISLAPSLTHEPRPPTDAHFHLPRPPAGAIRSSPPARW